MSTWTPRAQARLRHHRPGILPRPDRPLLAACGEARRRALGLEDTHPRRATRLGRPGYLQARRDCVSVGVAFSRDGRGSPRAGGIRHRQIMGSWPRARQPRTLYGHKAVRPGRRVKPRRHAPRLGGRGPERPALGGGDRPGVGHLLRPHRPRVRGGVPPRRPADPLRRARWRGQGLGRPAEQAGRLRASSPGGLPGPRSVATAASSPRSRTNGDCACGGGRTTEELRELRNTIKVDTKYWDPDTGEEVQPPAASSADPAFEPFSRWRGGDAEFARVQDQP